MIQNEHGEAIKPRGLIVGDEDNRRRSKPLDGALLFHDGW